jgi:AraC family transcriptional regulator of adaptative response / DNA-3-methyladenine glycosylase II
VFHALFKRPPAALRQTRGGAGSASESSARQDGVLLRLAYRPPYDFGAVLAFLAARAIPGVEVVSAVRYARTIEVGGVHGTLSVEAGRDHRLDVTVRMSALTALPSIIARVRRQFDLSADPVSIASHLAVDPILSASLRARPGLRVPGAWDGFELAIRAILGQQISVGAATALADQLVQLCGVPLHVAPVARDVGLSRVFPSPDRLASFDLSPLRMPRARIATLSRLAAAVAADPSLLAPGRDLAEAVARLRAVPGIGEWTAQYIAMRQLREPDAFPAADVALLRALAVGGQRPTAAELSERAEAWRPWRAYAAMHLWSGVALTTTTAPNEETRDDRSVA